MPNHHIMLTRATGLLFHLPSADGEGQDLVFSNVLLSFIMLLKALDPRVMECTTDGGAVVVFSTIMLLKERFEKHRTCEIPGEVDDKFCGQVQRDNVPFR